MQWQFYKEVKQKTQEYLGIPSVVGAEDFFLEYLKKDFQKISVQTQLRNGYLVVGDQGGKVVLSAHTDRHGLMVNLEGEIEFAYYVVRREKYQINRLLKSMIWKDIAERFIRQHMYAYNPKTGETIASGIIDSMQVSPDFQKAVFYSQALSGMSAGTPIGFSYIPREDQNIIGQIDNVICIALTYCLYKYGYTGQAIFTTGEEIGKSYPQILDYLESLSKLPKLLVLDTTPMASIATDVFDALVLRNKDNSANYDGKLTQELLDIALQNSLAYIIKDEWIYQNAPDKENIYYGDTELGQLILATQGKYTGTTLQIPTKNYHTNSDETNFEAIKNVFTLVKGFLKQNDCWK